jgi:DNA-binding NarL/FixJ family response regulator
VAADARFVIRVLVVDDHQAVRAGLVALLRQEPGFVTVGTASTVADAVSLAAKEAVDVAVIDYHLPDASGVELCRLLPDAVGRVIYTGVPLEGVTLGAVVAGARGVVAKSAPVEELFDVVREVARGRPSHPPVTQRALAAVVDRVREEDWPIVGMALDHTDAAEMAEALRVEPSELERRIDRVLSSLRGGSGAGPDRHGSTPELRSREPTPPGR